METEVFVAHLFVYSKLYQMNDCEFAELMCVCVHGANEVC